MATEVRLGTPSAAPGSPAELTAGFQPPVVVTAAEAGAASGIKEGAGRRRVSQREVRALRRPQKT